MTSIGVNSMTKIFNPFTVLSAIPVKTSENEIGMWATGSLSLESEHLIPSPDSFSVFIRKEYEENIIGTTISLVEEDSNSLFMLPNGHDSGAFIGSDINSGIVYYGDLSVIDDLKVKLEKLFLSRISILSFQDFESSGFSFMTWNLNNDKALLILYNDTMYGIEIPKEIKKLPLLAITMGGDADDMTAIDVLMPLVYSQVKDNPIEFPFEEEFIEYLEGNFSSDYISFSGKLSRLNGNELKGISQKELLEVAHLLMCDFLQLHLADDVEYLTEDTLEFARRVNEIKQNSK